MKSEIDVFKVLEENGFNIKQIIEKSNEKDSMIEQLLEKIEELKKTIIEQEVENETILSNEKKI